jgi:PKD repeat protein
VDNQPIDFTNQYTFKNIQSVHTLEARFTSVNAPEASFSCTPTNDLPPLSVQFDNQSVNQITQYRWDFGDGTYSSQKNPIHTFSMPGNYTVSLTVTGPGGTNNLTKPNGITVQSEYINFKSNIQAGPSPLTVSFMDTSKGYTISHWDFGDGHTSETLNPAHVYEAPGINTVTASSNGITKIIKNYIAVQGRYISGSITNNIPDCLVQVNNKNFALVGKTFSDAQGDYTITDLMPLSDVSVCAWPPKNSTFQGNCIHGLNLQSDHISNLNINLKQRPSGTITGRILNSQNNGLADMPVFIVSDSLCSKQSTRTNEQGQYTFTHLSSATDYLVYSKMPLWHKTCYYAGEQTVDQKNEAALLNLNNQVHENITIITPETGIITGQIFVSGSPASGVWVKARSNLLKTGNAAQSDANGQYTIVGLLAKSEGRPVTYIVDIHSSGYSYQAYSCVTSLSLARPVTVGSRQIDFHLYDEFSISGIVTDINNIPLAWDEPSTYTQLDGYFMVFNQNDTYQLDNSNIAGQPFEGTSQLINCSGDDDFYYFHIVPAYYDFNLFEYVLGQQSTVGPYRIDTKPPYNLNVLAPEVTSSSSVDLTITVMEAMSMCISNSGFGDCQGQWSDLSTYNQWYLPDTENGPKTIFVQCSDLAGNTTERAVVTTLDQSAPSATITLSDFTGDHIFIVNLTFNETITGFEDSDIAVGNGNIVSFVSDEIHPDKKYILEISPEWEGLVTIYIPEGVAKDRAGNKNVTSSLTLQYGSYSVPALNTWGLAVLFTILQISNIYVQMKKKQYHERHSEFFAFSDQNKSL